MVVWCESDYMPQGTVSAVCTHAPSHLLTASDDNTVAVVRMGSWQVS